MDFLILGLFSVWLSNRFKLLIELLFEFLKNLKIGAIKLALFSSIICENSAKLSFLITGPKECVFSWPIVSQWSAS